MDKVSINLLWLSLIANNKFCPQFEEQLNFSRRHSVLPTEALATLGYGVGGGGWGGVHVNFSMMALRLSAVAS